MLSNPKPFGFIEVDILAPDNLTIPIIQTKVKLDSGATSTIAPLGSWKGWYFLKEIYKAMEYGYTIKIDKGYLLEKKIISLQIMFIIFLIKKIVQLIPLNILLLN